LAPRGRAQVRWPEAEENHEGELGATGKVPLPWDTKGGQFKKEKRLVAEGMALREGKED